MIIILEKAPIRPKPKTSPKKHRPAPKKKSPVRKRRDVVDESSDEEEGETTRETSSMADVTSNSWVFNNHSEEEDEQTTPVNDDEFKTPNEKILKMFLVEMPDDFYSLYEFCESLNGKNPKNALKQYGLQLVGPFDVLSGT